MGSRPAPIHLLLDYLQGLLRHAPIGQYHDNVCFISPLGRQQVYHLRSQIDIRVKYDPIRVRVGVARVINGLKRRIVEDYTLDRNPEI